MKTKVKLTPEIVINDRMEAEASITVCANLTINLKRMTSQMDARIAKIRGDYQPSLDAIQTDLQKYTQALCDWAQTNPGEFAKGRRSIEFANGTLGFRMGTPKLALLSRAWTWDKVLAALKGVVNHFVRVKEEVDKEAILGDFSQRLINAEQLALYGVKVTHEESFYVDPKLTEVEQRQTVEA